jgi:hypothetical protein
MRRISFNPKYTPLLLALAALGSYAAFIPWFGLFGDDWPYLWIFRLFGTPGYIDFVAWDRPFSAWIYLLVSPLFQEKVWLYHLFLVGLIWLDACLVWWVLGQIWPDRPQQTTAAALLFLLYPGFQQQPLPLEFMLHFGVLALFFLSLGVMIKAARQPGKFWGLTAVGLLGAAGMFSLEYFVGLELLRPVLLWMTSPETDRRERIKKAILGWLPYLVFLGFFFVWRVFVLKFPSYQPELINDLSRQGGQGLVYLAERIVRSLVTVTAGAWRETLHRPTSTLTFVYIGFVGLCFLISWLFLYGLGRRSETTSKQSEFSWALQACGLGGLALVVAGLPFWAPGIPIETSFPWDRTTLPFMLGASLLAVGLVTLVLQRRFQMLALAVLAALALGSHVQNAGVYRGEWQALSSFFWQLGWRAPELKPGTILVSGSIPLYRYSDNDLTAPLNWVYAPDHHTDLIPYKMFDLDVRKNAGLPALKTGLPVSHSYRSVNFKSDTSSVVVYYWKPPACLRLLSKQDAALPDLPEGVQAVLPLSNLSQVQNKEGLPAGLSALFGPEPGKTWCAYFQKADLARQNGEWEKVSRLLGEAQAQGLQPADQSEWLPFIEGLAAQAQWEQARQLNQKITNPSYKSALCALWKRTSQRYKENADALSTINVVQKELTCNNP